MNTCEYCVDLILDEEVMLLADDARKLYHFHPNCYEPWLTQIWHPAREKGEYPAAFDSGRRIRK